MHAFNCPNCGSALEVAFAAAKMTSCPSCDTTVFLDGDQITRAGSAGAMHDAPQLIAVGDAVTIAGLDLSVIGHARFDYGLGWWDEYWAMAADGSGHWISVDEGDVILQFPVVAKKAPSLKKQPRLGQKFQAFGDTFRVTEIGRGTCLALRGSFPEALKVGEVFDYANCLNDHSELLSGEFSKDEILWFQGVWCDPFDIKVAAFS